MASFDDIQSQAGELMDEGGWEEKGDEGEEAGGGLGDILGAGDEGGWEQEGDEDEGGDLSDVVSGVGDAIDGATEGGFGEDTGFGDDTGFGEDTGGWGEDAKDESETEEF